MQTLSETELLGFVELQVGSYHVQVPIRAAESTGDDALLPLATFETDGNAYAILVRGDTASKPVEQAMALAARDAVRHLSQKLLN
jgi:hypothetical protein